MSTDLNPTTPNNPAGSTPTIPTSDRRRLALAAVVTSAVLVGGAVVGTQFVSADAPTLDPSDESEAAVEGIRAAADDSESTDVPADEPADQHDDQHDDQDGDQAWVAHEQCLGEQLGIDLSIDVGSDEPTDADLAALDAVSDEQWEAADAACESLLPEEIRAELAAFDEFDECITEQLGERGIEFAEGEYHGSVVVEGADEVQFLDFGDDDGTITITKVGDEITTATDGDVTVVDMDALEDRWAEEEAAWDDAHEACESLLPDGAFDDEFDDEFDDAFDDDELDDDVSEGPFDDEVSEPAAG